MPNTIQIHRVLRAASNREMRNEFRYDQDIKVSPLAVYNELAEKPPANCRPYRLSPNFLSVCCTSVRISPRFSSVSDQDDAGAT